MLLHPHRLAALALAALAIAACSDDPADTTADGGTGDVAADTADDTSDDAAADGITDTADAADASTDAPDPNACWTDLAPGETETFYDGFPPGISGGSEGIAFGADGRLYVTSVDTVYAFGPDGGEPEAFATVPDALGLAPWGDGLVVASIGATNTVGVADGAVYFVDAEGDATLWADGIDSPNFITMMPDGSALVSDDFDTRVWRVTADGDVSEAITGIGSPNGMAYTPDGAALVVVSTFTDDGEITRIPVDDTGVPAADGWERIAELGSGATGDGIAIGASGDVFVAANLRGQLVRIPADGTEWSVFAEGLGTPASMAFGAGAGFDPCSMYVTQLFGSDIVRVAVGEPGAALVP